jgi:hypothetical protein
MAQSEKQEYSMENDGIKKKGPQKLSYTYDK